MRIKHNKNRVQFLAYRKHITHKAKQRLPFHTHPESVMNSNYFRHFAHFFTLFSLLLFFSLSFFRSPVKSFFFSLCVCAYWIKDCKTLKLRHIKRQCSHPLLRWLSLYCCLALNCSFHSSLVCMFCVSSAFFCSSSASFVLFASVITMTSTSLTSHFLLFTFHFGLALHSQSMKWMFPVIGLCVHLASARLRAHSIADGRTKQQHQLFAER